VSWKKLDKQTILPQHENGVDWSAKRSLLLSRKMPDKSTRTLVWQPGHTGWVSRGQSGYYTATLDLHDSAGRSVLGIELLEGGRLNQNRLKPLLERIAKHFGCTVEDLPKIERRSTYVWEDK